jgi:hypothetical protein
MRRLAIVALLLAAGCATYRDDLARGQTLYVEAHYDQALAIWRVLEADQDSLDAAERSKYAYLRGMTDYRLGMRADARHWLALAKVSNEKHPGGLDADAAKQLELVLSELNEETYRSLPGSSAPVVK